MSIILLKAKLLLKEKRRETTPSLEEKKRFSENNSDNRVSKVQVLTKDFKSLTLDFWTYDFGLDFGLGLGFSRGNLISINNE